MKFIEGCKTAREARKAYPGAAVVRRVEGGYAVFETVTDYQTWRRQK